MKSRVSTPQAIERLASDLALTLPDSFSQDWESQVASRGRSGDFVKAYREKQYDEDERFVLMRLIIQAFDEALQFDESHEDAWREIVEMLLRDAALHESTIKYWCLWDEDDGGLGDESWFSITKQMRQVHQTICDTR